jgi:hypothetical protein
VDASSIELPGCEVESIRLEEDRLTVHFSRAYIVKTMTGSVERTRWWQAGDLIMEGVELKEDIPAAPLICAGGDVGENVYTYRDMIPLPLESRGRTRVDLKFQGTDGRLVASGQTIRLAMVDVPKYIEHLRP